MVVLRIKGLTSPICSNVITLLANEGYPNGLAIASATAVCQPAQNSSNLNTVAQSIEEWHEPGAVLLVISLTGSDIFVFKQKFLQVYFLQIAAAGYILPSNALTAQLMLLYIQLSRSLRTRSCAGS